MINIYNADRRDSKVGKFILKHFGASPVAAAERVEGMFSHHNLCSINSDYSVSVFGLSGEIVESRTLEQHLVEFCNHTRTFRISEYLLESNRSLRLIDLWDDDPIGSAGPKVVDASQLTNHEQKEIQAIFSPFSGVIHPEEIYNVVSRKEIKAIKRRYAHNSIFKSELKKRKSRSNAIGEDFKQAQYQEIVWLDLTFKLKQWALGRGYDSFVYYNEKEGNGEDAFITLLPNQVKDTGQSLEFLEDKYMDEMPNIIRELVNNYGRNPSELEYKVYWGQKDPMRYWG